MGKQVRKNKVKIRGNQQLPGKKGAAVNFITRNQALKKLQLTLPQFRKLCILKGVYPREPKKAPRGKDKTYYFKKDILYLEHDILISKMAEQRIWKKKLKTAKDKKNKSQEERLKKNKPKYSLNHIIKERYPTFIDALRDLDDALTLIFLFAELPATNKVSPARVANCRKLAMEFEYYIIKTNALRKVFVSIKGFYYQAEIRGQTITWVVPLKFSQKFTREVDYNIMSTFLEFYEILVGFVNFKLFHSIGLNYPPKFSEKKFARGDELDAILEETKEAVVVIPHVEEDNSSSNSKKISEEKKKQESKARLSTLSEKLKKLISEESEGEEEDGDTDGEADADPDTDGDAVGKESNEGDKAKDNGDNEKGKLSEQTDEALFGDLTKQEKELNVYENLFAKSHFWLSREVPKESLEFVIRSFGGKVSWEYSGDEKDESITHTVVDRDWPTERIVSRDYIQPQWVYDCINARVLIPTGEYGAGAKLPPHLSPFVDDYAEGYIPEYRKKLEGYYKQVHGIPVDIPVNPVVIDDESESDEEQRFAQDLAAEKEGNYQDTPKKEKSEKTGKDKNKRKKRQNEIDEEEQKVTAESLLPQKKRRLLQTIKYSRRLKQRVIEKLEEKKQKLQDGTAQVVGKDTLVYSDPQ